MRQSRLSIITIENVRLEVTVLLSLDLVVPHAFRLDAVSTAVHGRNYIFADGMFLHYLSIEQYVLKDAAKMLTVSSRGVNNR